MSFRTALGYFINRLKMGILTYFNSFGEGRTAEKEKFFKSVGEKRILKSTMILISIKK